MKINVVRSEKLTSITASLPETQKVADILEKSKDFENYVRSIRKYLNLPTDGVPYPLLNPDKLEEMVNDTSHFAWTDNDDDEYEYDLTSYCTEIAWNLDLPLYWDQSIYNFILYNIFITPEKDNIDIYPAELWRHRGTEMKQFGLEIILKERLSKNEFHNLIDKHWSKIELYSKELSKINKHKMIRSDLAKRIEKMKDAEKKSFKAIADILDPESIGTDYEGLISEDYVKGLYHRWKKIVLKIKKSQKVSCG